MNYTEKYYLPQWEETDRVMRTDFNDAMARIEEGVAEAKGTADAANHSADSAYSPARKPYAVGTYTGTGAPVTIDLGFRPSFVIVCGASVTIGSYAQYLGGYRLFSAGNTMPSVISFSDKGFTLQPANSNYPTMCKKDQVYDYIAFR